VNDTQTRTELKIFSRFADVCALSIVRESIVKRSPPEPDIVCRLATEETVAFELVEIIDEGWASLTSGQFREMNSLREAYQAIDGDLRCALDERVGNALVYVSFVADVSARQRRAAVPEILSYLSTIGRDFSGDWEPASGTSLHRIVRSIRITSGDFRGPEFDVEAVSSIADPTIARIRAKWLKSYNTPHPIELLACYELQPQMPAALWLPRLESFVTNSSGRGLFRRVWVFDVGARAISYESGVLASTGRLTAHAPDGAASF
jgi:hypothetical protein